MTELPMPGRGDSPRDDRDRAAAEGARALSFDAEGGPSAPAAGSDEDAFSLAALFAPPARSGEPAGGAGSAPPGEDASLRAQVEKVLDQVRPFIQADGGDIRLVSVIDGVVRVTMHGACVGCSSSIYTLQLGLERKLKEEIPGIKYVEAV